MGKHVFSNYPAASNRIPASVGPMKAPRANTEVHRPDTLKWKLFLLKIMIIFGVVLHLPARKCRWYQGIRPAPEKSGYNKFVFYSFTIFITLSADLWASANPDTTSAPKPIPGHIQNFFKEIKNHMFHTKI